jgi:O-antigen ligase
MMYKQNKLSLNFLLTILYFCFLPLEDFIFKGIISSSTRIIGAALIISFFASSDSKYFKLFIYEWPIVYFLLVAFGMVVLASYKDYYAIFRVFNWVILYFIIATIIYKNLDKINLLFSCYIFPALYISILNIFQFISNGGIVRSTVNEVDENLLGLSISIAAIFSIFNIINKKQIFFNSLLLIIFILSIIACGSRSSLVGLSISILGQFKLKDFKKISYFILFLGITGTIILQFPIFTEFVYERFNILDEDKGSGRTLIWSVGVNIIYENWILGVGYRNFPYEFSKILGSVDLTDLEISAITLNSNSNRAAHNIYLSTFVELGIFGILSLFIMFKKSIYLCLNNNYYYSKLFLSIIILFIVFSVFIDTQNLKMFWFALSLPLSLNLYKKNAIIKFKN